MKTGRSISCYIYTSHSDMRLWTVHNEQLTANTGISPPGEDAMQRGESQQSCHWADPLAGRWSRTEGRLWSSNTRLYSDSSLCVRYMTLHRGQSDIAGRGWKYIQFFLIPTWDEFCGEKYYAHEASDSFLH